MSLWGTGPLFGELYVSVHMWGSPVIAQLRSLCTLWLLWCISSLRLWRSWTISLSCGQTGSRKLLTDNFQWLTYKILVQGGLFNIPCGRSFSPSPKYDSKQKMSWPLLYTRPKDLEDFIQTDSSDPWLINQKARIELQKQLYTR